MKTSKKIIAVILLVVMLFSTMPITSVSAEEAYDALQLDTAYNVSIRNSEHTVSFTPDEEGWYRFYSTGSKDTYATLYDSDFNVISSNDELLFTSDYNFTLKAYLEAQTTYYLTVNSYEARYETAKFKIYVEKTVGVESVRITKTPDDLNCTKGYELESISLKGLEAVFTLSDGSEVEWSESDTHVVCGINVDFDVFEDENGFCALVSCGNASEKIYYNVVEVLVDRIEFNGEEKECYEDTNGWYDDDLGYFVYNYGLDYSDTITVYYKDGTVKECRIYDYLDGVHPVVSQPQEDAPWGVGDNYYTISYMGVETQVKVTVLPCTFKSIRLISAPTKDYVYGEYGYGYRDQYGRFVLEPTDLTGLVFNVEYFDGTTETIGASDIDMKNQTIQGYEYYVDSISLAKSGTAKATLHYKGAKLCYDVDVLSSHIRSIEIESYPEVTDYEFRYGAIFEGMQLRITYENGRKKIVTLTEENTTYNVNSDVVCCIDTGEEPIYVERIVFGYCEVAYGFACMDKGVLYEGLWIDENREVENISVENFSPYGEDMIVNVTYEDGSSEQLNYDTVALETDEYGFVYGCAKTKNGIIDYEIVPKLKDGEIIGYTLYTMDSSVYIEGEFVKRGDANLDSDVDILDVTIIQQHCAQHITLEGEALKAADADRDQNIAIMDATTIQRFLAKIIDVL